MSTVYNNIQKNKNETIYIMILFTMIITFLGWIIGELLEPGTGTSIMAFALIGSGIMSYYSYYNSDKMVLSISGAKEVLFEAAPDLHNLVDNMCIASGLPKPRIYIIEDTAMNAFATGRDPQHAVICFTTGILSSLEKRELEGVVAHELSHIQNYDIRLMSIVSVLVGTIALVADFFTRGRLYKSSKKNEMNGVILLIALFAIILSPIIANLIKLAVSRKREFLADASAALMTRYPQGLASALKKLSADQEILEAANSATAHLYISNPIKKGTFSSLFETHPPIEERIRRLEQM